MNIQHPTSNIQHLLQQLAIGEPLWTEQAVEAFEHVMAGHASPAQVGAMLAFITARGPTVDELVGAATVMRRKAHHVEVPDGLTVIDTCGVGGTGSRLFNISTVAGLIAAAVGRPRGVVVAKHGNRSITSRSGSSSVLEELGVNPDVDGPTLTRCLDETGFCLCYAPAHHPAMKYAAPVRRDLGFRTIFNLLGPLTNPAGATRQLIGVPTADLAERFAAVLDRLGADRAMLVHSRLPDGQPLGELTNFGPSHIHELHHGMIKHHTIDPAGLGVSFGVPESIAVAGPAQSAALIRRVLAGEHGTARDIARLNAAAALVVADLAPDLAAGLDLATEALDTGAAAATLDHLAAMTQS